MMQLISAIKNPTTELPTKNKHVEFRLIEKNIKDYIK